MEAYAIWERNPTNTGWDQIMAYGTREEAREALDEWVDEYREDHGGIDPMPGRHYRLTMDLDIPAPFPVIDISPVEGGRVRA